MQKAAAATALCVLAVLASGCLVTFEDAALDSLYEFAVWIDHSRSLNLAEDGSPAEARLIHDSFVTCGPAGGYAPGSEAFTDDPRWMGDRFEATWTVTAEGIDQVIATGKGQSLRFPLNYTTTYQAHVDVVDNRSGLTEFDRDGYVSTRWFQSGEATIDPGAAEPRRLMDVPVTLDGQSLFVMHNLRAEDEGSLYVVGPDGYRHPIESSERVQLATAGAYALEWQSDLPVQFGHSLSFFASLGLVEDRMPPL